MSLAAFSYFLGYLWLASTNFAYVEEDIQNVSGYRHDLGWLSNHRTYLFNLAHRAYFSQAGTRHLRLSSVGHLSKVNGNLLNQVESKAAHHQGQPMLPISLGSVRRHLESPTGISVRSSFAPTWYNRGLGRRNQISPNQLIAMAGAEQLELIMSGSKSSETQRRDAHTFDLTVQNVQIPAVQTTYWCRVTQLPRFEKKHHIIRVSQQFIEPLVHIERC
ncbi:unnamed protein product [Dicrocoelium dendriticum]|nr:unnamed protein product [Dicrocoelium dendriticum]